MINRDGINPSLWQKTSDAYQSVNQPVKDTLYDVIIVGGGITGMRMEISLL
jgi:hypothetical protein